MTNPGSSANSLKAYCFTYDYPITVFMLFFQKNAYMDYCNVPMSFVIDAV